VHTVAKSPIKAAPPKEMTDEEKTITPSPERVALTAPFALSPAELDLIRRALSMPTRENQPSIWNLGPKIQALGEARAADRGAA